MAEQVSITYRDYSDELSTMRLRAPTISAANFDAQNTLRDTLVTAIGNVTLGVMAKQQVNIIDATSSLTPASSAAQRELKWLVKYRGTDGVTYNAEIACPDITDDTLLAGNSDLWDPSDASWVTFIAAFEALVIDSDDGAVVILEVRLVGRNT